MHCSRGPVTILADGIFIAERNIVSSPNQEGDGTVGPADQAIFAAKLGGPYDPTADFNCSAALESGDQDFLDNHLGHSCAAVVPVRSRFAHLAQRGIEARAGPWVGAPPG